MKPAAANFSAYRPRWSLRPPHPWHSRIAGYPPAGGGRPGGEHFRSEARAFAEQLDILANGALHRRLPNPAPLPRGRSVNLSSELLTSLSGPYNHTQLLKAVFVKGSRMAEAVIVATARTPIGKACRGAFNATQGQALTGHAI